MTAASESEKTTKISFTILSIICYVDLHILVFWNKQNWGPDEISFAHMVNN